MADINNQGKTIGAVFRTALMFCFNLSFFTVGAAFAASVTLSWNRNQEPDIKGYNISWGTEPGQYTKTIFIGDKSTSPSRRIYTINDLEGGHTYYFALQAVDLSGQTSSYSREVVRYLSSESTNSYSSLLSLYSDSDTEPDFEKYPVISGDMNGDNMEDLMLFGETGVYVALSEGTHFGQPSLWYEYSSNSGNSDSLSPGFQENGWQVQGTGDINGDGYNDIVLANPQAGAVSIWFLGEAGFDHELVLDQVDFSQDSLQGMADFDGNGTDDLLWQNNITGELHYWSTDKNENPEDHWIGVMQGFSYHIEGIGDYDGNGTADLLWHYIANDMYCLCLTMDNNVRRIYLWAPVDKYGSVAATGDFNGDGTSDILWHNPSNGDFYAWLMDSEGVVDVMPFGSVSVSEWKIFGAGDINNDGLADIIWRYDLTGDFVPLLTQQAQ